MLWLMLSVETSTTLLGVGGSWFVGWEIAIQLVMIVCNHFYTVEIIVFHVKVDILFMAIKVYMILLIGSNKSCGANDKWSC